MALGENIRCRLRNDGPIATTVEARRLVARTVLEIGRPFELLSFRLVDTHLHAAKGGEEGGAEFARRLEGALTKRLGLELGFERVRVDPVQDIWHLYRLFTYVLKQGSRHGVGHLDPLFEATNLPDLLGLRTLGLYTAANVRRLLPRIHRAQLLEILELEALEPADGPIEEIPAAAAAAVCRPHLRGMSPERIAARRAAVEIVGDRIDTRATAALLQVSRWTVTRLRADPSDPTLVMAVRLQLGLCRRRWLKMVGRAA